MIKNTKKGRGVFATCDYIKGDIIERCQVIAFSASEVDPDAAIGYYVFDWEGNNYAVALGNGSLYNHSFRPNAIYLKYTNQGLLLFQALRNIECGEEVTVNYNGDPKDRTPIKFLDATRAKKARGNC